MGGKLLSVTDGSGVDVSSNTSHVGNINPLRYRGYYYDTETGLYYLNSRYYDPEIKRFINADGSVGANQDLHAYNVFAYCSNNPVSFSDNNGMWKQVSNGWAAEKGDTLWGLAVQLYGNGSKWTSFGFSRDPRTLQIGEVIKTGGSSSNSSNLPSIKLRDVTREINNALKPYVDMAEGMRTLADASITYEPYVYIAFALLVNHGAAWDIKRKSSWERTIGTTFPGYGMPVLYAGAIVTPENLGNYTYGHLGAAFGIPYKTLLYGSVGAAGVPNTGADISNELNDWKYITMGYISYHF